MNTAVYAAAVWASFYTVTITVALWRRRNRRGAIIAAVFAVFVLVAPIAGQIYLASQ